MTYFKESFKYNIKKMLLQYKEKLDNLKSLI